MAGAMAIVASQAGAQEGGAQSVLVINGTSTTSETSTTASITAQLTGLLEAAGNTVTVSDQPPADITGFDEVWDIRFSNSTPIVEDQRTQYLSFLQDGNVMFVMGENSGFATRNDSVFELVEAAGGGTLTFVSPASRQTVNAPFNAPNEVEQLTYNAPGGVEGPGNGIFITEDDAGNGAGVAFGVGDLDNAPQGALTTIFDVNFMQETASEESQDLLRNLIDFLNEGGVVVVRRGSDVGVLAAQSTIAATRAQTQDLWQITRASRAARDAFRGEGSDGVNAFGMTAGDFSTWVAVGGGGVFGDVDVNFFSGKAGIEYGGLGPVAVGLMLGGGTTSADTRNDTLDGQGLFAGPYASFSLAGLSGVAGLTYTRTSYDSDDDADSIEDGDRFAGTLSVGYDVPLFETEDGRSMVTPFVYGAGGIESFDGDLGDEDVSFVVGRIGARLGYTSAVPDLGETDVFLSVAAEVTAADRSGVLDDELLDDYDDASVGGVIGAGVTFRPVETPISMFASVDGFGIGSDQPGFGARAGFTLPF